MNFNEVQEFGLSGLRGTDGFKLDFDGTETAAITSGTTYTAAGIKAAIEAAIGGTVTASSVSANGFTLTYTGAKASTDVVQPDDRPDRAARSPRPAATTSRVAPAPTRARRSSRPTTTRPSPRRSAQDHPDPDAVHAHRLGAQTATATR